MSICLLCVCLFLYLLSDQLPDCQSYACLSFHLSICQLISQSVCLSICLPVHVPLSTCLPVWTGENDWHQKGFDSELPHEFKPCGYYSTTNNNIDEFALAVAMPLLLILVTVLMEMMMQLTIICMMMILMIIEL